jgi:hypothetical protein
MAWRGVWPPLGGRDDEVERLAREGLRLAERAGAPDAHRVFTAQLLVTRREQGRLGELVADIELFAADGARVVPWPAILPLAYLGAGDVDRARAALAVALAADWSGLHRLTATAWLAEAAASLADATAAERLLDALRPHAGRLIQASFTSCWGAVDRVLGLVAAACGSRAEAERHLEAALRIHTALAAQPLIARTRRDLAALR